MGRKNFTAEQIIFKLREVEVLVGQGDPKHWLLECASASLSWARASSDPGGTEKAFINLDNAQDFLLLGCLVSVNQRPECQKVPVHGLPVELQEQSSFGGINIDAKAFSNFSDFVAA